MLKKTIIAIASLYLATTVTGCTRYNPWNLKNADYWQRTDITDSIYTDMKTAQKMLDKDIAQCTNDVRELQRMSKLREATPAEPSTGSHSANSPSEILKKWDTPEYDGYLRTTHMPYHDFETCMQYKGWSRISNLPKETIEKSKKNYIETRTGKKASSYKKTHKRKKSASGQGYSQSYINL